MALRDVAYFKYLINSVTIAASAKGALTIPNEDKERYGQMNALKFSNLSPVDVSVYVDGDTTHVYRVPASSELTIQPEDGVIYNGVILIENVSATTATGANVFPCTMSRQPFGVN